MVSSREESLIGLNWDKAGQQIGLGHGMGSTQDKPTVTTGESLNHYIVYLILSHWTLAMP